MSDSRGEAGVAGRQGEAGVSGPQGEPGRPGPPGDVVQGEAGPRGLRGRSLTNTQITAVFLFVVLAFVVLSVRTEIQQRQISRNAHRIEVLNHGQCEVRNAGARNQIRLIDSAIAAEKRKPRPDAKRLRDLEDFKPPVVDCGPKP